MRRLLIGLGILMMTVLIAGCGGGGLLPSPEDAGGLVVDNVTALLTLPSDTGAAYMRITNNGDSDDALINATIDGCGTIELHEIIMEDDVMQMRQVEGNRILIPAGQTVTLEPGGLHVMCIGKTGEFAIGQPVPVMLTFENAGEMEVIAQVLDPAAMEMEGGMGDEAP
jgi:copper(I)-binding protein